MHGSLHQLSTQPLIEAAPLQACQVCVVIPVRDEALRLEGALAALAGQVDLHGRPVASERYEVIVLANNCTDASASIARVFARTHPEMVLQVAEVTLPQTDAHTGTARRLLMNEAWRRLTAIARPDGVIATTDGDTRVAPDWLAATLHEIELGAEAVGGRILADTTATDALEPGTRLYYLRDRRYRRLITECESYLDPVAHDPWPRHHHHFGASMAATLEAYARAGGMPAAPVLEDLAFYHALLRVDARFRHSLRVRAVTSPRRVARAPVGLGATLQQWHDLAAQHRPYLVPSARVIESTLRRQARLRSLWQCAQSERNLPRGETVRLAADLAIEPDRLAGAVSSGGPFGTVHEAVERWRERAQAELPATAEVEIGVAIEGLRALLCGLRMRHCRGGSAAEEVEAVPLPAMTANML